MTKQVFKVGDLVRVPGRSAHAECFHHGFPQGSVCVVVEVENSHGNVELSCPGVKYTQGVGRSVLRLAKQAMRKREQYMNRRG